MVFMADFLFFGVGTALCFFKISTLFKQLNFLKKAMCRMCAGYKKYDVKTIEVWRAEQNKRQGVFALSAKNWVLFCGDCFRIVVPSSPIGR